MKNMEVAYKLNFDKEYNKIHTLIVRVDGVEQPRENFKTVEEYKEREAELIKIRDDMINE